MGEGVGTSGGPRRVKKWKSSNQNGCAVSNFKKRQNLKK